MVDQINNNINMWNHFIKISHGNDKIDKGTKSLDKQNIYNTTNTNGNIASFNEWLNVTPTNLKIDRHVGINVKRLTLAELLNCQNNGISREKQKNEILSRLNKKNLPNQTNTELHTYIDYIINNKLYFENITIENLEIIIKKLADLKKTLPREVVSETVNSLPKIKNILLAQNAKYFNEYTELIKATRYLAPAMVEEIPKINNILLSNDGKYFNGLVEISKHCGQETFKLFKLDLEKIIFAENGKNFNFFVNLADAAGPATPETFQLFIIPENTSLLQSFLQLIKSFFQPNIRDIVFENNGKKSNTYVALAKAAGVRTPELFNLLLDRSIRKMLFKDDGKYFNGFLKMINANTSNLKIFFDSLLEIKELLFKDNGKYFTGFVEIAAVPKSFHLLSSETRQGHLLFANNGKYFNDFVDMIKKLGDDAFQGFSVFNNLDIYNVNIDTIKNILNLINQRMLIRKNITYYSCLKFMVNNYLQKRETEKNNFKPVDEMFFWNNLFNIDDQLATLNIDFPERFEGLEIIKEIIKNRAPNNIKNTKKPIALLLYNKYDSNHAFETTQIKELIKRGYYIVYCEAGTENQFYKYIQDIGKIKLIDLLVIAGHGSQASVLLGKDIGEDSEWDISDTNDLPKEHLDKYMNKDSMVILESCSTGEGKETANNVANLTKKAFPRSTVFAPTIDTGVWNYYYDKNGKVTGVNYANIGEANTYKQK